MTTPDLTADGLTVGGAIDGAPPAGAPAPSSTPAEPSAPPPSDGGAGQPAAPTDPARRRRMIIAIVLGALFLAFLAFATWYLLFRKPISQLPIPNIAQDVMPGFSFAAYDLQKPLGIAVSADGSRIYVTQTSGDQATLMLDARGTKLGVLTPPAALTARATQLYVAVDPKTGEVYATDRAAGAVFMYTADGAFRGVLKPEPDPGAWQPLAIAFDQAGNLYVADAGGAYQTIREIDRSGHVVLTIGQDGTFNFPNGIAIDKNGLIYVTDSNNGRLVVFDQTGKQLGVVRRGPAPGELSQPRGIAIDDQGHVFVVDTVGQGVQVYRPVAKGELAPRYVDRFGREGTVDGAFEFPNGIAVDSRGHVYVADWNNDRIQVWSF